ncbi:MAG TPA: ABC transporter substrate-binding protein [Firmicutes bacterium]|nr:ABC transporter substrate-binding protein [Bacillota bacterium]
MHRTVTCLLALVVLLSIATQVSAQSRLLLYTSVPLELATKFVDEFTRTNKDIKVEVFRAGSTDVVNKIWAENEAGGVKADVVWLADAASYHSFKAKGLLYPYKSPEAAKVPAELRDPDGYFTAARLINMVIGINTSLVKPDSVPRTWNDLLAMGPKAAMANPLYSGSNFMVTAAFVNKYGGWGWLEQARKNGVQVLRGNSDVSRGLGAGEFAACMVLDYMVYELKKAGAPVDVVWPEDGTVSIPSPVAIISGTKNLAAAKAFIDFALSKTGQEFMVRDGVMPVRPDVAPPPGMPTPDRIKVMPIPYEWAADHTSEIRETFEKLMLK